MKVCLLPAVVRGVLGVMSKLGEYQATFELYKMLCQMGADQL